MAVYSKLLEKASARNIGIASVGSFIVYRLICHHYARKASVRRNPTAFDLQIKTDADKTNKGEKTAVDSVFFRKLWKILKLLFPGWFSVEMLYMVIVAFSLAARTYCDVWMIQNGTSIESSIIGRDMNLFKKYLFRYITAMPIISIVNNLLKYGLNQLKLKFRTRLSTYLYHKYLNGFTYYKMSNLDNRITNADQLLTTDVVKFCDSIADLYSNLSKPLLDICIYAAKLTSAIGAQGPGFMLAYLVFSGLLLTRLRRPIAKMTVVEQKLEGEFRYVNSRLITNSEEIAFYQGNVKERNIIMATFIKLIEHLESLITFRFGMGLLDNMIAKYFATTIGYLVVSRPFLDLAHPRHLHSSHSERLEDYYKSGRMLVRMAEAIGRVVLAGRELTRLAGFTQRVTEFIQVLDDLNNGKYQRTMVTNPNSKESLTGNNMMKADIMQPGQGKVLIKDYVIKFEDVPLITPNGDVLVETLNFEVKSGMNVLVCGPNGCGKSSLFRILGELWPMFGGTLTKPPAKQLFYIPQRPYMTLGKLRDQIIYPDNKDQMLKKGVTDQDLENILEKVQLEYILEREGGWDSIQDWMDVLSGGEKQRIAMARLFYNKPQFAILDECTSAVSVDVEGYMYQHCREVGITLFTVSHRKSLWKHHEYFLHMDGRGSFDFKPITADTVEFGS